jgi:signal transduction histidine kinase
MDATEEGGTIEIATELTPHGEIRIDVRDDGCGISAAARERIFQPYFTTKESGTGLGLFVCRKIVEQTSHGRIELAESSSQGTMFAVYLPAVEVVGEPEPDVADAADAVEPAALTSNV